ncbi:enoyl-CoA hydratase/isomerase family protein [Microbacterium lacticum]
MSRFRTTTPAPGVLRATYDNPPINLLTDDTVADLEEIADRLDGQEVHVLVLDSANPDYFMARYDVRGAGNVDPIARLRRFADVAERIAASPVVSIAAIRGRCRGGGNEIALACDLRFAARENAMLGQPEVPFGLLPAGGGIERLTRLIGRARALEVIISGADYDADTAERYGWVNRALPDAELDAFVAALASRIARFDASAVAAAKRLIGRGTLPDRTELDATISEIPAVAAAASPQRRQAIAARAAALGAEFEADLGTQLDV